MNNKKRRGNYLWVYVVGAVVILVMVIVFWFSSGVRSPKAAARSFVQAWAAYDISGMKAVSTSEMSEGMVDVYFSSIKNSVDVMRQAIASSEGLPLSAMEMPVRWDKWSLKFENSVNGVVDVTGQVTWKFSGYDQTSTVTRNVHWVVYTEKLGNEYRVSGVDIMADDPQGAVWNFMESLMSRNSFYIKKTVSAASSERLLGYLAAMQMEFTQGSAQKGWIFLHPMIEKTDQNEVVLSYYRVALGSGSGSSFSADPAVVTAKFTCSESGGHFTVQDVEFEEAQ